MENCKKCDNSNTCRKCIDGFKISLVDSSCVPLCELPCTSCIDNEPNSCLGCIAGYELNSEELSCTGITECSN